MTLTTKPTKSSALILLDDHNADGPSERAWSSLTYHACVIQPRELQQILQKTIIERATPSKNRVFSSRPTLRQLMSEYNRPTHGRQPIHTSEPIQKPTSKDFTYDTVTLIRIPSIPGKILRPSRP